MPAPPDIYEKEVDFTALALQYPDFAKKLKANGQLDFSDPESVRQLTKALLRRDFNLTLALSDDRLCPPVPNRFNYILFVQRLLDSTSDDYNDKLDNDRKVIGLDIGTGASAIYPLLACRQRPAWRFLATEIDPSSRRYAIHNIQSNGLQDRIKVLDADDESSKIIPSAQMQRFDRIDFLMTNPPFYGSQEELQSLAKKKSRPPNSACTGAPVEMICPGGEVAFVGQILTESSSSENREKIQWFSSMLGKLSSVTEIIDKLKELECTNYAVTEFVQGQKTRRWCVAWSWMTLRPSLAVVRGTDAVEKKYLPFPTELELALPHKQDQVVEKLQTEMSQLTGMHWRWRNDIQAGIGRSTTGDVWSRHARRKQKKLDIDKDTSIPVEKLSINHKDDESEEEEEPRFVFKVTFRLTKDNPTTDTVLNLRWLQGDDSTLFESFHGWLKRKLSS